MWLSGIHILYCVGLELCGYGFRARGRWRRPGMTSIHLLHQHADLAAAGEADLPGGLVGDPEFQHLWLATVDHIERFGDDGALDAAAGNRAEKIAVLIDDQIGADRARRRAPGLDHGGERHGPAFLA